MAKLKYSIAELVEAPGTLREFYTRGEDGKFHLDVDGDSPKLAEFRTSNRSLNTAKTELEAKLAAFDGIDPVAAKEALAKLPELVKMQDVTPRVTELEEQLAAERDGHQATKFKQITTYEFLKAGGRESAVDFFTDMAAKVFKMADGQPTTELFSTANPGTPLTLAEFVQQQMAPYHYIFAPSRGGGARPSQSPLSRPVVSRDPLDVGRNLVDIASGKATVE